MAGFASFATTGRMVVGIGRNYALHAKEMKSPVPTEPFWFLKPPSSYLASGGKIEIPAGLESIHHEVELGVIIGGGPAQRGKNLTPAEAMEYVAGYCIALDMTARDWQNTAKAKGLPWAASKGFDTSLPVGAFIPKALVKDPMDLTLWCKVNGDEKQRGSTKDMIFDVAQLVSVVSRYHSLQEGDLILTGTPEGVGPVVRGDSIQVGITELGAPGEAHFTVG
mmetsp:Transcript_51619/g.122890  ORF Transcript_51619/g.122890 Transcript_51619/m.122890 type:complete len:222 (+) Transcript_51619:3-668(+)